MKRSLQFGALALTALLMMQPALAGFGCAPAVSSNPAGVTCPSSTRQRGECSKIPIPVLQGRDSCCYLDAPDSTQQAIVDRSARDQRIANDVMEQALPWATPRTQRDLRPDRVPTLPLAATPLQSLYCTFLK
jgi:hypothetical protein